MPSKGQELQCRIEGLATDDTIIHCLLFINTMKNKRETIKVYLKRHYIKLKMEIHFLHVLLNIKCQKRIWLVYVYEENKIKTPDQIAGSRDKESCEFKQGLRK